MEKEQIFLVALEEDEEEFPYVLINLSNARLVQNYEDIPTIEQIESWIGEVKIVAPSNKLTLHLNFS
ncbi:hypothetical protein J5Y03_03555 [Bacillus sp. RG28]|uniref:Uncharacterized protein n=1 Tax=Gottfriedia endophytica TaxID=2820819 RepID=A0A940NLA1_9BACI|nr:hypothetical protein [Gottfriedia endophytica]MBP0724259.1 hypothetical protein [Gottfriedia endophytica]